MCVMIQGRKKGGEEGGRRGVRGDVCRVRGGGGGREVKGKRGWISWYSRTCIPNHQRWYANWKLSWNTTHCTHVFFARLAPIRILSRCPLTKIPHRSSVRSLLRVHCWLGKVHCSTALFLLVQFSAPGATLQRALSASCLAACIPTGYMSKFCCTSSSIHTSGRVSSTVIHCPPSLLPPPPSPLSFLQLRRGRGGEGGGKLICGLLFFFGKEGEAGWGGEREEKGVTRLRFLTPLTLSLSLL